MSGVQEWADELYSHGLSSVPDKSVCAKHYSDSAVITFIRQNGAKGECDYCGLSRNVVELEELMKFLMETVGHYYTDPVEFANYDSSEGGYTVTQYDGWEILEEIFELKIDENALLDDMHNSIDYSKTWADEKFYYSYGHYSMPDSWDHFCYLIKHRVRYLFPSFVDKFDDYHKKPLELLEEVGEMVKKYKLISEFQSGHQFYRCRQHDVKEIITEATQICAPPIEYCFNPNRMSPAGISMFYCSEDIDTALVETLDIKWTGTNYTTAVFKLKENINVIDLTRVPNLPSIFDSKRRSEYSDILFLRGFVSDLTKEIIRDGKVHIEYVPTQVVTEFFRFMFSEKVDGILYPSSKSKGKSALVLFYDNYDSLRKLEFDKTSLVCKPISNYK